MLQPSKSWSSRPKFQELIPRFEIFEPAKLPGLLLPDMARLITILLDHLFQDGLRHKNRALV